MARKQSAKLVYKSQDDAMREYLAPVKDYIESIIKNWDTNRFAVLQYKY